MKDIIIAYDIADDKRLRKVAKYLEKKAVRVQYSIFYLPQITQQILKHHVQAITKMIDTQKDDVRFFEIDINKTLFLNKENDLHYIVL